jgi:hypothetical protein
MGEFYNYETIKKELYHENLMEVIAAAQEPIQPWLDFKVKSFCDTFTFGYEEIIKLIRENLYFAAHFIKDPGRQNFYENQGLAFIKTFKNIVDANKLSASGNEAYFVINGELVQRKNIENPDNNKSIDFLVKTEDLNFFVAHKYTLESGGAQDNQYNDLLNFILNANLYQGKDFFIALADGDYYQNLTTILDNKKIKKIDYLKHMANKKNVFATTINEFEELIKLIKEIKK